MPTWPKATVARLNNLAAAHKGNLRSIADAFASQEGVDSVSQRHVNDAHSALGRVGLRLRPWYRRTELETALGGVCWTSAVAAPDVIGAFVDEESLRRAVASGVFVALAIIGTGLAMHAWFRGQFPTKTQPDEVA